MSEFEEKVQELESLQALLADEEKKKRVREEQNEKNSKLRIQETQVLEEKTREETLKEIEKRIETNAQQTDDIEEKIAKFVQEHPELQNSDSQISSGEKYVEPTLSLKFKKISDFGKKGKVRMDYKKGNYQEGPYVCFLGQKDSGKTMFCQQLCGNTEACKKKYRNEGLDYYYIDQLKATLIEVQSTDQDVFAFAELFETQQKCENRKSYLTEMKQNDQEFASMAEGMNEEQDDPFNDDQVNEYTKEINKMLEEISSKKANIINEFMATNLLLFKFILQRKGVIVVPVKDYTAQVERFLQQLIDFVYDPYDKQHSEIVVIHNYSQITEKKEIESRIKRAIKNNHNVGEYDEEKGYNDYSKSDTTPITHLVYARENSKAGDEYNEKTIRILRSRIKQSMIKGSTKYQEELKEYLSQEIQKYYDMSETPLEKAGKFSVKLRKHRPKDGGESYANLYCETIDKNPKLQFKKVLSIIESMKLEQQKNTPDYQVYQSKDKRKIQVLLEVSHNIQEPQLKIVVNNKEGLNYLEFRTENSDKAIDNKEEFQVYNSLTKYNQVPIKRGKIQANIAISPNTYTILQAEVKVVSHENGLMKIDIPVSEIKNTIS